MMTKATCRGMGLFGLHLHITVYNQKKSGQEHKQGWHLEVGADAQANKRCCLLAYSP